MESELVLAARALSHLCPKIAVDLLADGCRTGEAIEQVKKVCEIRRLDYYKVLGSMQRPFGDKSNQTSPIQSFGDLDLSSSSPTSASSGHTSASAKRPRDDLGITDIYVHSHSEERETLSMIRAPQSHSLVHRDVVYKRLQLRPRAVQRFGSPVQVQYHHSKLDSSEVLDLRWRCVGRGGWQQTPVFLVEWRLDAEVIFGDMPHDHILEALDQGESHSGPSIVTAWSFTGFLDAPPPFAPSPHVASPHPQRPFLPHGMQGLEQAHYANTMAGDTVFNGTDIVNGADISDMIGGRSKRPRMFADSYPSGSPIREVRPSAPSGKSHYHLRSCMLREHRPRFKSRRTIDR